MKNAEHANAAHRPMDLMHEMSLLQAQALQEGVLSKKVKELLALAVAVSHRCESSIAYHLHNALEAGATREEIREAVNVAMVALAELAAVQGAQVLRALAPEEVGAPEEGGLRPRAGHPYMSPD